MFNTCTVALVLGMLVTDASVAIAQAGAKGRERPVPTTSVEIRTDTVLAEPRMFGDTLRWIALAETFRPARPGPRGLDTLHVIFAADSIYWIVDHARLPVPARFAPHFRLLRQLVLEDNNEATSHER